MIIEEQEEQVDYVVKIKKSGEKQEPRLKQKKEFVKSFNKESEKQNSEWFAEIQPSEYNHLRISKYYGWWIFKGKISLFVGEYENHFSFVDNDYAFSDYGIELNKRIFKYLPEIKPILEKINQVFFILQFNEIGNFELEIGRIGKEVEKCKLLLPILH